MLAAPLFAGAVRSVTTRERSRPVGQMVERQDAGCEAQRGVSAATPGGHDEIEAIAVQVCYTVAVVI
jgi:hypothetical protein